MEVRYNLITKEVTGWWTSRNNSLEAKLKNRPDEAIIELDIEPPPKSLRAYLCDGEKLTPSSAYIEPVKVDKMAELEDRLAALEKK